MGYLLKDLIVLLIGNSEFFGVYFEETVYENVRIVGGRGVHKVRCQCCHKSLLLVVTLVADQGI